MSLQNLLDKSYQTFMTQIKEARIILLHPESLYRSLLVAQLVNDEQFNSFYYAMGPDDINLHSFLTSIIQTLANQHPTFGRHIHLLPHEVYRNPNQHLEMVLDTFAKDLMEINSSRFLLILDEYDRSDRSDDVQRFVERLSTRLPENYRMVINSRTLPRLPWVAMIAHGRAVMLKDDQVVREHFYGDINHNEQDALKVFALGPSYVKINDDVINTWEGHLPRLLFFFSLDRPIITRSEICQAFWPELESDQAVNVFHVTKRRLHKALEADVLIHGNGYYRINPDMKIYYDVSEFVMELMRARNAVDTDIQLQAWQRAIELYRGPFLQGHNDTWIIERREEFQAGYIEALTKTAYVWEKQGRLDQALSLIQKAINTNNNLEVLHRDLMRLYVKSGRRNEAINHYQKLSNDMQVHGLGVSEETSNYYAELLK